MPFGMAKSPICPWDVKYFLKAMTKTFPPDEKLTIQLVPNPINWSQNACKDLWSLLGPNIFEPPSHLPRFASLLCELFLIFLAQFEWPAPGLSSSRWCGRPTFSPFFTNFLSHRHCWAAGWGEGESFSSSLIEVVANVNIWCCHRHWKKSTTFPGLYIRTWAIYIYIYIYICARVL